jgi:hypothetical protein
MSSDPKVTAEHSECVDMSVKDGSVESCAGMSPRAPVLDDEKNRKLLRKIDMHLMPVVRSLALDCAPDRRRSRPQMCFTYALQYYDKVLLSQAAIFGLRTDLGIEDGLKYSWVSLIFYFGYIAGCYPVRQRPL